MRVPNSRRASWTVMPSKRLLRPATQLLEGGRGDRVSRMKSLSENMLDGVLKDREKRFPPRPMVFACTDFPPAATTTLLPLSTTAMSNTEPGVLNEPIILPVWAEKTLTVGFESSMLPHVPAATALPVWEKEIAENES